MYSNNVQNYLIFLMVIEISLPYFGFFISSLSFSYAVNSLGIGFCSVSSKVLSLFRSRSVFKAIFYHHPNNTILFCSAAVLLSHPYPFFFC